jgi:ABC-type nitrate/sulfonate/bicarbonate transport system permease component
MASTADLRNRAPGGPCASSQASRVALLRTAIVVTAIALWEAASASGYFYRDVVPSLISIGRALAALVITADFYRHLGVTLAEVGGALTVGGALGIPAGLALGGSKFLSRAFEHYLYYLGPTPKIVFFPIMIMWFGVGSASKMAMGALSCFFPIVLSVASGMRQIDPVLIRVGRSFHASTFQMATKVHLPAMKGPILNGVRLGFGVAIIGTLLAETKLSNAGIGYLIMQAYAVFDMPRMYAMLIVLFALAIGANELVGRCASEPASRGR